MCRVRWSAIRPCSSSSSTPTSTAPTATCSTPARSPTSPSPPRRPGGRASPSPSTRRRPPSGSRPAGTRASTRSSPSPHVGAVTDRPQAAHLPGRAALPQPGAAGEVGGHGRPAVERALHPRRRHRLPEGRVLRPRRRLRRAQRAVRRGARRDAAALDAASRSTTRASTSAAAAPSAGRARCSIPIPIWIGGNAKLTLRRVAERAQGWMPLTGPAEMFSTVRSPARQRPPTTSPRRSPMLKDLRRRPLRRARLRRRLHRRGRSPTSPHDVERHRDAFGRLEEVGATWSIVPGPDRPHPSGD